MHIAFLHLTDLQKADLQGADLQGANLWGANLWGADLQKADLQGAALQKADLQGANLQGANLWGANLHGTNLSGAKGLLSAAQWLKENLTWEDGKLVCYKAIGGTHYPLKSGWVIEPGSFLEEVPNPNRTDTCGCGVNVGTSKYVSDKFFLSVIWKCYIHPEDLVDVVVPYNTDGKFRAARVQLVEIVK